MTFILHSFIRTFEHTLVQRDKSVIGNLPHHVIKYIILPMNKIRPVTLCSHEWSACRNTPTIICHNLANPPPRPQNDDVIYEQPLIATFLKTFYARCIRKKMFKRGIGQRLSSMLAVFGCFRVCTGFGLYVIDDTFMVLQSTNYPWKLRSQHRSERWSTNRKQPSRSKGQNFKEQFLRELSYLLIQEQKGFIHNGIDYTVRRKVFDQKRKMFDHTK